MVNARFNAAARRIAVSLATAAVAATSSIVLLGGAASGSCGTGANPGGSPLNINASFDYACQWAATPSTTPYTYANDSASFASQLLTAGGMRPSSGNWNATNSWWTNAPVAGSGAPPQHSLSWASAPALYRFLTSSGNATELPAAQATLTNTQAGDLIFWDWSPVPGTYDDVGVIVSGNGSNPATEMYAAHGQTTAGSSNIVSLGGLRSISDMLSNRVGPYLNSLTAFNQTKYGTTVQCPAADAGTGTGRGTCWTWHIVRPQNLGGNAGYSGAQSYGPAVAPQYPTSIKYGGTNAIIDTAAEADAVIAALRAPGSDVDAAPIAAGLNPADAKTVGDRVQATTPTSGTYGGTDASVDGISEEEALGADLATRADRSTLWAGLWIDDKNEMLAADDSHFTTWTRFFDTQPPSPPVNITADGFDSTTGEALITWEAGADPDIATGINGTGSDVDRFDYRWRRNGGAFGAWVTDAGAGFAASPTALGDSVTVEIRGYDLAGNVSASTTATVTVDVAPATPSTAVPVLLCAVTAPECLTIFGAAAGALVVGAVVKNYLQDNGASFDVKSARATTSSSGPASTTTANTRSTSPAWPTLGNTPTFGEWEKTQDKERGKARDIYRRQGKKIRRGSQIHHIVPVTDKSSEASRAILYHCNVSINDPANLVPLPKTSHYRTYKGYYHANLYAVLKRYEGQTCLAPIRIQLLTTLRLIGAYLALASAAHVEGPWPI